GRRRLRPVRRRHDHPARRRAGGARRARLLSGQSLRPAGGSMNGHRNIGREGLWRNNPALVQLLGLCPLLAVSNSVVNSLGLGLATVGVLTGSNLVISLLRKRVRPAIRLPAFVLIIAAFVTAAELLLQAYAFELYRALG